MIAVALKGLLGRKTRAILTALAIVLGAGMVSATFIFTDTLNKAFNGVFSSSYKQTSLVVSGKQIVNDLTDNAYSNDTGVLRITLRDKKITRTELVPASISRSTGQPIPATGAEAQRISAKFAGLRPCTGSCWSVITSPQVRPPERFVGSG